jgi:uncharacterized protein (TIGR00645 family)
MDALMSQARPLRLKKIDLVFKPVKYYNSTFHVINYTFIMIESFAEKMLYASRWLLAPIYLGLSFGLLILGVKFFQEIIHVLPLILSTKESDLVLIILSLIDLSLVGGLLVMVMLSGYENFVSSIDLDEGSDKLHWLGKMDAGSLKQKVAASIVAISSIHLLQKFMNAQSIDNDKLQWYVIIHLTFVVSAIGMAYVDKINKH